MSSDTFLTRDAVMKALDEWGNMPRGVHFCRDCPCKCAQYLSQPFPNRDQADCGYAGGPALRAMARADVDATEAVEKAHRAIDESP